MNLGELMLMFKEMGILDERCSVREVTAMFVKVNLADAHWLKC